DRHAALREEAARGDADRVGRREHRGDRLEAAARVDEDARRALDEDLARGRVAEQRVERAEARRLAQRETAERLAVDGRVELAADRRERAVDRALRVAPALL